AGRVGGDWALAILGDWNEWSERGDSNSRPLAPEASALPGCATLRPTGILLVSGVFSLRGQAPSGRMCSQGITRPPTLRQRCDWRPRPSRSRAAPASASGCALVLHAFWRATRQV